MLDESFYEEFAAKWLAAWNAHDLEGILSRYEEAFEFSSPVLAMVNPPSGGGSMAASRTTLLVQGVLRTTRLGFFRPIKVLKAIQSLVILYEGLGGKLCAEFCAFSNNGNVAMSHAHEG